MHFTTQKLSWTITVGLRSYQHPFLLWMRFKPMTATFDDVSKTSFFSARHAPELPSAGCLTFRYSVVVSISTVASPSEYFLTEHSTLASDTTTLSRKSEHQSPRIAAPYLWRISLRIPKSSQIKGSSHRVKCLTICCSSFSKELGRELSE